MDAQLIIMFGIAAVELVEKLYAGWKAPTMTLEEFKAQLLLVPAKSLTQYLQEAGAKSRPQV